MRLHDLERWLAERGWQLTRITGSHRVYRHASGAVTVIADRSQRMYSRPELHNIRRSIQRALECVKGTRHERRQPG